MIFKPLDGMGGASIFRLKQDDPNVGVIIETLTNHGHTFCMAQNFLPAIKDGDKRIRWWTASRFLTAGAHSGQRRNAR